MKTVEASDQIPLRIPGTGNQTTNRDQVDLEMELHHYSSIEDPE